MVNGCGEWEGFSFVEVAGSARLPGEEQEKETKKIRNPNLDFTPPPREYLVACFALSRT